MELAALFFMGALHAHVFWYFVTRFNAPHFSDVRHGDQVWPLNLA